MTIRRHLPTVLALTILGVSGYVSVTLISAKPIVARNDSFSRVLEVEVETVESRSERTPVVGFGTVRARNQVEVVPLVGGKLTYGHPNLAQGKIIREGEVLYELDPTIYEARHRQVKAEIDGLEASLERLDQEAANLAERIATSSRVLQIDESDFDSTRTLYEVDKVGTQREVDMIEKKFLQQKDLVTEMENRLALLPHQRTEIQAKLDGARAQLKQAQYNLDATKIVCPFDARVEAVHARESQVVMAHLSIATLTDISAFELSVGIDPRDLRWLAPSIRPEALGTDVPSDLPDVTVRWSLHGQEFTWKGRVSRFEKVDERTRTAQMVVEVLQADMVAQVDLGDGATAPRLSIGMFCSAELPARKLEDAILVPRHAIYDNRYVYVFSPSDSAADEGRIERREVAVLRSIDDQVLVDYHNREGNEVCELQPGEQVVVSRLTKPVVGMQVKLRDDEPEIDVARLDVPPRPSITPVHTAMLGRMSAQRGED